MFLEILHNSQENTCVSLFFQACNFIKKGTLAQVFSCEFCEISNTYSYRTPLVAAFVLPAKKIKKKSGIPELVKAIGNVTAADASAVNAELEIFSKKIRKKDTSYNTSILTRVMEEVGKYVYSNGTKATINNFKCKYPQYDFFRTSNNNWKRKFNNQEKDLLSPIFSKRGRPYLVRDNLKKCYKK